MVTHEWGVRWFISGRVTPMSSERVAHRALAMFPDRGEVVSRWVRESPWKAD